MIQHAATKGAPGLVGGLLQCERLERVQTCFVRSQDLEGDLI